MSTTAPQIQLKFAKKITLANCRISKKSITYTNIWSIIALSARKLNSPTNIKNSSPPITQHLRAESPRSLLQPKNQSQPLVRRQKGRPASRQRIPSAQGEERSQEPESQDARIQYTYTRASYGNFKEDKKKEQSRGGGARAQGWQVVQPQRRRGQKSETPATISYLARALMYIPCLSARRGPGHPSWAGTSGGLRLPVLCYSRVRPARAFT